MSESSIHVISYVCVAVVFFMFGAAVGSRLDHYRSGIDKALAVCEINGGLHSLDAFNAYCENGAQFRVASAKEAS